MLTVDARDALAAAADRLAERARRHAEVAAFEIRADWRRDRQAARLDGRAVSGDLTEAHAVGLRVWVRGGGATYVSAPGADAARCRDLVERAVRLARAGAARGWTTPEPAGAAARRARHAPPIRGDPFEAAPAAVEDLLRRGEAAAQAVDPQLRVHTAFGARVADIWYQDSAGSEVAVQSVLSTLRVAAVARGAGRVEEGVARAAGPRGVGDYETRGGPEALGAQAAAHAIEALQAVELAAGRHRVLCDNHLSGMLAHESFGHLTEHDLVASGWSTLRGRRGETLAAPIVSILDAPVVGARPLDGVHVPCDDQGVAGATVTMLAEGVLASWMHSRDTALAAEEEPKGNGRALDARFPAMVRMRNTYFAPGEGSVEDALEALGDGVYLVGARGGAPYSDGSFMFTATRGYLVRGGKLADPVRSTAIHGNILDFLRRVEMATADFELYSNYFGGCGKGDQSFLHVGVGGPHLLVDGALAGGQAA